MTQHTHQTIEQTEEDLRTKPASYWNKQGEEKVLTLFYNMSKRVPAYKEFLKTHEVDPQHIKTYQDLKRVPTIDKNNYLRVYSREMLCWDGIFKEKQWTISTTSGSTGEPYYFPRTEEQDKLYAKTAELYLRTNFQIHKHSTLYIVGFPMGAWIGGLFTYKALNIIQQSGKYALSVITPGINKIEIIKAVKNLGHHFDQIIIGSYGPFLKDILDDGEREGLDWKQYKMGFVFSAEAFNETFRDYVQKKTGLRNIYLDTLNHYGTVDIGTMSYETPLSILLRRLAIENKKLYSILFGEINKLPTLTQYNPTDFFFENNDGSLLCSSYSGLPLVRYDLKDNGGILQFDDLMKHLQKNGIHIEEEIKKHGLERSVWHLPFVYVYERNDFSVSFYAFQIYPETIRKSLQHLYCESLLTSKFTMQVVYDQDAKQQLEIHIELHKDITLTKNEERKIQELIVQQLLKENSEYRKTYEEIGKRIYPHLFFYPYEDTTYFRPGVKQKWVKK